MPENYLSLRFQPCTGATIQKKWNIYAKRLFGGPQQVFEYLGRYIHRVANSNHHILNIDETTEPSAPETIAEKTLRNCPVCKSHLVQANLSQPDSLESVQPPP